MRTFLLTAIVCVLLTTFNAGFNRINIISGTKSDSVHFIGERYGGGIIFFISEDGKHGLIVANPDQKKLLSWSNGKNKLTGTNEEDRKYKGIENTISIVNFLSGDNPSGIFAAKSCLEYSTTADRKTYDDWYLPSKQELNFLFQNNRKVANFDERYYWSSNEVNIDEAWVQSFYDGRQLRVDKSDENYVIAIREF